MTDRRPVRAVAALAAALLSACGNYSTEDLRFLAAMPTREDLRVAVPAQAAPAGALQACGAGTAETWLWAKPTSDRLNAMVDFLTGLVDVVRRLPPSWRDADARGWGPFDDDQHPGKQLQVVIVRTWPAGPDGPPAFTYALDARPRGGAWTTVLSGAFTGASATLGAGTLTLRFDLLLALGMADPGAPDGPMSVAYDRTRDPRTISLELSQPGSGLQGFQYAFTGYRAGSGRFHYVFTNAVGDRADVDAGFDGAGGGRAHVQYQAASGATGGFDQCWDAGACLVWVDDPLNLSCTPPLGGACSQGAEASCPAVP